MFDGVMILLYVVISAIILGLLLEPFAWPLGKGLQQLKQRLARFLGL